MKYRVEGHSSLLKDDITYGVVNSDHSAYKRYMQSIRARQKQSDEMRDVVREINTLKNDMLEIKELLKGITNGR